MTNVINFPEKTKENLTAVHTILSVVRKMHDEGGYRFTSSELKR